MTATLEELDAEGRTPRGRRIKELRERLGLKQREAASIAGIDRTAWVHLEKGTRNHATGLQALEGIAKVAGVPLQTIRAYLDGSVDIESLIRSRGKAA